MQDQITVMIVDDSASVRSVLSSFVREDPGLELMAAVPDPFAAAGKMRERLPDVILLDLHMPRMDGLTFLGKIMAQRPIPTIVVSSFAKEGSEESLRALELGAVEVLTKPDVATPEARQEAAIRIGDAIRAAVQTRHARNRRKTVPKAPGERHTADVILPPRSLPAPAGAPPLIVIGASTGGTEALRRILTELPPGLPPVAVVQHMPAGFTRAFADRLDQHARVSIAEASQGARLGPGQVVIARGDVHLVLERDRGGYRVGLREGPNVARHRPSVDVLFRSAAQVAGASALGVLLTGMGDDGAAGLGELQASGALTLAQDEASSVVWGMPRVAIERGVADRVVALDRVGREIQSWAQSCEVPVR